ncbi:MAG: transcription termination/antitermination protein NusA [Candidatus Pacebacteria bacterium]|nr:transcription termination/antitermination protein NusA [Candidatus Paceibacterota bacterium]
MDQKQFVLAINQICEEKGISKEKAIEVVEASLASAYKKEYGKKGQIIKVNFDEISGDMKVFQVKIVAEENDDENEEAEETIDEEKELKKKFNPDKNITVEEAEEFKKDPRIDDEIEIPLPSKSDFGRIAAQTAKQVMIQKIREAEKEAVFDEFKDKEGEVVNGTVQRIEGRNVFIDIGKAVGILYPTEQIVGEKYNIGQRLKIYIVKLDKDAKEASLILSRTSPDIIEKLFELEVPEIFSKTVEIKSISREAGSRTKVAVCSNEEGIDPVGSCVGQRGSRIQTIINELGGEKIDIIEWNDNTSKYIQHALSPAKIARLDINEEKRSATAFVEEDQLSLAIGKQGQNVRLAAKLTGWKIDILEEKKKEMTEEKSVEKEEEKDSETEPKEDKQEKKTAEEKTKAKKEEIKNEEKAEKKAKPENKEKKIKKEDRPEKKKVKKDKKK